MMHFLLISTTANKLITAFSWMLIHSLWQGLLLAIIVGTVLVLAKRSGSTQRYNVALVSFVFFMAICASTFIIEWNNASSKTISPLLADHIGANISSLFSIDIYNIKRLVLTFTDYFSANAPMVVMIWLVVFMFKSVRMIACMVYNHRVRHTQIYQPDEFWVDVVGRYSEKLQIKKAITLLQSGYVKMPVVIGHLKPVILIPIGLMANLPAEQVEAILLHEMAHIRRNDYFVNFLQNIAEAIFFFNPGLLWISSLLREERENCADDIALEQTQNKKSLIQALISFKEHELYGSKYATTFPGKKNYLLRRVSRIMGSRNKIFGTGEKIFFSFSIVLLGFVVCTAAFGRYTVKAKKVTTIVDILYTTPHDSIPTDAIPAKNEAGEIVDEVKSGSGRHSEKMRHSIAGIKLQRYVIASDDLNLSVENNEQAANTDMVSITTNRIISPIKPVTILIKKKQELSDRQQAIQDQIQVRQDQEEAYQDQLQAKKDQEEALRDQRQAEIDQVQALKDQAQARIDQAQALKEKANTDMAKTNVNN